jgi:Flp pilus assembly protein TadG
MKVMRGTLRRSAKAHPENGQSLLETAVAIPLLLGVAFNIINFAYFWFMVLALSAAPRQGVQFLSQGGAAEANGTSLPAVSSVCDLVADNVGNGIMHSASLACGNTVQIRVCAANASGAVSCTNYGPSLMTLSDPAADPEPLTFSLQRVDVVYQVRPIIPGGVFNAVVPSNLNFHRQVSMRNLY